MTWGSDYLAADLKEILNTSNLEPALILAKLAINTEPLPAAALFISNVQDGSLSHAACSQEARGQLQSGSEVSLSNLSREYRCIICYLCQADME